MNTKKSGKVTLILVSSIAVGIVAACSPTQSRACVDPSGAVVDSRSCDSGLPAYFWYYGGLYRGGYASGGSYQPSPGVAYKPATSNVARGGLGTTASAGNSSVAS